MSDIIKTKLQNIIKDHLGKDAKSGDTFDDLGADSLDLIEMVMACEEQFGIDIPDGEAEAIKDFDAAYIYLCNKTQG